MVKHGDINAPDVRGPRQTLVGYAPSVSGGPPKKPISVGGVRPEYYWGSPEVLVGYAPSVSGYTLSISGVRPK
jgi:hypothetical protein